MKPEDFFQKIKNDLNHIEQRLAQDILAVEAEGFHEMNFRNQGFTDTALIPWPKRKTTIQNTRYFKGGSYELDHKDKGLAILVQTSNLKGLAIKGRVKGDAVVFTLPDYGKVHNEGGRAGRGEIGRAHV